MEPKGMVQYGERFFMSLGFPALPSTFWERSMFTRPRDRDVVCHASAWDIDYEDDLRIKMCIEPKAEDFSTIHHELGHNFYQRAYKAQPPLFRDSANDGFHEAIGETIALSVTPEYLKQIGLLDSVPPASSDIGLLMQRALDKVAFLPFGLLIDKWRWGVFSGKITPADYNKAWWDLRLQYQGVAPPVPRSEHSLRSIFPRGNSSIPISSRPVPRGRLQRAAALLLRVQQQSSRRAAGEDTGHGQEPSLARGARSTNRRKANGCHCDSGLFRSAQSVAGRAKQKERRESGLVSDTTDAWPCDISERLSRASFPLLCEESWNFH
jgi:hypothetical protein